MITQYEKNIITEMRFKGYDITSITKKVSQSQASIRNFCSRNNLTDEKLKTNPTCINCGETIIQPQSR